MENAGANQTEIESRVRRVIAETFRVSPDHLQGELGMGNPSSWDSLGHMELVMQLEKEFGVMFPNFVIADLVTVPAIVRAITERAK